MLSGSKTMKFSGSRSLAFPGTKPVPTSAAAMKIRAAWRAKDEHTVLRRSGDRRRQNRLNTKVPIMKLMMAVTDLTQRYGDESGWPLTPRPT